MAARKLSIDNFSVDERRLTSRYRRLAQSLNSDLGFRDQRLVFNSTVMRDGLAVWQLINQSGEVGSMIAVERAEGAASLEFAFSEHWSRHAKRYVFKSSNLRFHVRPDGDAARAIQFRLEWADREQSQTGEWVFPGQGAAHPHWQFDNDFENAKPFKPFDKPQSTGEGVLEIAIAEPVKDATSTLEDDAKEMGSKHALAWFHKLHLPARAHWADRECRMPDDAESQQHSPKSFEELDRWLLSALRYLRHEFNRYAS